MHQLRRVTFRHPASATSHFAGLLLGLVGVVWWLPRGAGAVRAASLVYGSSLLLLFLASSCYHFFDFGVRANRWLQRLDHAAIYLFIAGSYAPFLVVCLAGQVQLMMIGLVALLATAGVTLKLSGYRLPDRLDTGLYVAMGWAMVLVAGQLFDALSLGQLGLLFGGGLAYTVGAIVYAREWPDPWPDVFGHHEVWHLFVLAGACAHFAAVRSLLGG